MKRSSVSAVAVCGEIAVWRRGEPPSQTTDFASEPSVTWIGSFRIRQDRVSKRRDSVGDWTPKTLIGGGAACQSLQAVSGSWDLESLVGRSLKAFNLSFLSIWRAIQPEALMRLGGGVRRNGGPPRHPDSRQFIGVIFQARLLTAGLRRL